MCWNASVSLQTFLFSTFPLVLCYYFGLISFSKFITFQTFISMQLVEYFLWTYLDTPWNAFLSKIGLFFILLFPLQSILFSALSFKLPLLGLYLCFVAYLFTFPIRFHTSIAKNKHLSWDWIKFPLPVVLIWASFYVLPHLYNHTMTTMFTVSVFFITLYTYYNTNTYGSMWCWVASFLSLYMYYLLGKFMLSYVL